MRNAVALLVVAGLAACRPEPSRDVRGRGLSVAPVGPDAQAAIYRAAMSGAFELDDPSLVLLLDHRLLPRVVGLAPAGAVPSAASAILYDNRTVKGACQPPVESLHTPVCDAARPGYVVRFSDVFALGARQDSVQVYLFAQQFVTPGMKYTAPLRFEKAFQVAKRGDAWRPVREGRVSKEVRGER